MTGRPARGIVNRVMREVGPISPDAPEFPLAATALAPLQGGRPKSSARSISPTSGPGRRLRSAARCRRAELTRALAAEAQALLRGMTADWRSLEGRLARRRDSARLRRESRLCYTAG